VRKIDGKWKFLYFIQHRRRSRYRCFWCQKYKKKYNRGISIFFLVKKEVKHFDVKFLILYGNVVIQTIVHFLKWVTDGMMVMMKEM
jgi:hypothetical protein